MTAEEAAEAAGAVTEHRPLLLGLAYRMIGSLPDAEDILQDAYLRWLGTDRTRVAEPRRYLTRTVTRLAIDRLRARQAARETYIGPWLPEPVPTTDEPFGPLDRAERRDTLNLALLHLLERLTPVERAVWLLHTAFDLPYAEIAEILDRTPEGCRQLHHRAAARLARGRARFTAEPAEQERLLGAFLAAARDGDLRALTALVAADATAWTDGGGRVKAARNPVVGADRIARFFAGILDPVRAASRLTPIEVNGWPAVLVQQRSGSRYVLTVAAAAGRITNIYLIGNPDKVPVIGGT
ncbi:RNA polymerase sigma factor SigJ [Plantactinospora sp. GCM10030261]|uniref:RNA polymerase sigma factor SigJ n=1 Tax=Plantactinospora sp. GCM10030261 TaxID=3273420 RepID=UPI0036151AC0